MDTSSRTDSVPLLTRRFGAPGRIAFREGRGGFPVAVLASRFGVCEVSLYGGQVLSYRPAGHSPVLFLSRAARFEAGRPVRGGIPLCWPWFGAAPETGPSHGFARTSMWTAVATTYSNDSTELTLGLKDSPETRALWPFPFELKLVVTLGDCLRLALTTGNTGDRPMPVTQSFHPYLLVRDIRRTTVGRIEGARCRDFLTGREFVQEGPLAFSGETDLLVHPPANGCVAFDEGLGRTIAITFRGTRTLVLWNPWEEKAKRLEDLGDDEYRRLLCIEPVNTRDTAVEIPPGKTAALSLAIQAGAAER